MLGRGGHGYEFLHETHHDDQPNKDLIFIYFFWLFFPFCFLDLIVIVKQLYNSVQESESICICTNRDIHFFVFASLLCSRF